MPQREHNRTRTPATGKLHKGIITTKDTQNNPPVQRHHWQTNGNINKIQHQSMIITTAQQEMAKQQPGQAGLSENRSVMLNS